MRRHNRPAAKKPRCEVEWECAPCNEVHDCRLDREHPGLHSTRRYQIYRCTWDGGQLALSFPNPTPGAPRGPQAL